MTRHNGPGRIAERSTFLENPAFWRWNDKRAVLAMRQIVRYLPYFTDDRSQPFSIDPGSFFDPYVFSDEVSQFIQDLYRLGFIVDFPWMDMADRYHLYREQPSRLESAGFPEIQRLFTCMIRADRFASGTIAAAIESGLVAALLIRIDQLLLKAVGREGRRAG